MAGITENLLEQTALKNINPNIPADAISEAVRKITRTESPSLIENNRRFHLLSPRQAGKSDTNRFGAGGSAL